MTDREWDRVLRERVTSEDPRRGEGCRESGQPTEVVRDPGKANNYARRIVPGDWRADDQG